MKPILFLLALSIAGCAAPLQYRNPGGLSEQQWNADLAECQSKSWGTNGVFQKQTFDYCMKGRGWKRAD